MVINGQELLHIAPIKNMLDHKAIFAPTTYGLSELGYDIRIKQDVQFYGPTYHISGSLIMGTRNQITGRPLSRGKFVLASAIEEFQMPSNLGGIVHDKSSWARKGLSVFNTVIEPGFIGGLTLELVYHGEGDLFIPAGSGIAQVVFHEAVESRDYNGKYQHQSTEPTPTINS